MLYVTMSWSPVMFVSLCATVYIRWGAEVLGGHIEWLQSPSCPLRAKPKHRSTTQHTDPLTDGNYS